MPGASPFGRRVLILASVGALAGGGITFALGWFQQRSAHAVLVGEGSATAMLSGVLAQDAALRRYAETSDSKYAEAYIRAGDAINSAQTVARRLGTSGVALALRQTAVDVEAWQQAAESAELKVAPHGGMPGKTRLAQRLAVVEQDVRRVNAAFLRQGLDSMGALRNAATTAIVLLAIVLGIAASRWIVRRVEKEQSATASERTFADRQAEFAGAIQMAEDETEVHDLLVRQLELVVPGASATILRRNNSENGLEAVSGHASAPAVVSPQGAFKPRDCLAIRFGRSIRSSDGGTAGLVQCKLCTGHGGEHLCVPSLVRGEVIGSVLVSGSCECSDDNRRRVESTVAQASPVLGNLRTLERAENQAATDGLTGLPNKRSFEEALQRLCAAAGRSLTPLSALMLDIDHFKRINDDFGHAHGDSALASVAASLRRSIRASDFVARYGGEEFVILLPETDPAGALMSAEKIRLAIAALPLAEIGSITVSIGVASIPHHAEDAGALIRAADHALYKAKETRNTVSVALDAASPAAADAETG